MSEAGFDPVESDKEQKRKFAFEPRNTRKVATKMSRIDIDHPVEFHWDDEWIEVSFEFRILDQNMVVLAASL